LKPVSNSKAKKMLFDILGLSPRSNTLLLFCIPPFTLIYFYAVGVFISEKTNRKNHAFRVLIAWCFVCLCIMLVAFPFWEKPKINEPVELIIALNFLFSLLLAIGILTRITVGYERSLRPERMYNFSDSPDYIKRFLCFTYFPFTIWSFQHLANEYRKPL
jgi:hypothetical protein